MQHCHINRLALSLTHTSFLPLPAHRTPIKNTSGSAVAPTGERDICIERERVSERECSLKFSRKFMTHTGVQQLTL